MKKILLTVCTLVCMFAMLTACGQKNTDAPTEGEDVQTETEAETTQTISGVVNRVGNFLVLLDGDDEYRIFDFGDGVDPSTLEEGDQVTVTYTGTLGSEDPAPVATAIEKNS